MKRFYANVIIWQRYFACKALFEVHTSILLGNETKFGMHILTHEMILVDIFLVDPVEDVLLCDIFFLTDIS